MQNYYLIICPSEFSSMRQTFGQLSFRRSGRYADRTDRPRFREQESFDVREREQEEVSDGEAEKTLTEYRMGGARYQYDESCQNHFKIKYWYVCCLFC